MDLIFTEEHLNGMSRGKYADGCTQLSLFNEAEPDVPVPDLEEVHPAPYKRKKRSSKKEENISAEICGGRLDKTGLTIRGR